MKDKIPQNIKSQRKAWYLLPVIIFLLGPLISVYLLVSLLTASKHSVTFYLPGTSQIYITKPGQYTLWIENRNLQRAEQTKADLQNMTLSFIDSQNNKTVTLTPKVGWSETKAGISHYSLGTLKFHHSGTYRVTATSDAMKSYKVYLRQPSLMTVIRTIAASFFLTILGIVTSLLFAIIILVKRFNYSRSAMNQEKEPLQQNTPPSSPVPNQAITWAMFCHLSGFAGFLFPLANIIAPLLIWGFKRHEYPYLDEQGKEAINFQISISIYYVIAAILILIVIGLFLLPIIAAFHIIAMIIASIETAHGKHFHYPLTIQFLR